MKILVSNILSLILCFNLFAQNQKRSDKFFDLSVGRTLFGTGDIPGLGVVTEFSKKVSKKSNSFLGKLCVGFEIKFETGNKQPQVFNPTPQQFLLGISFYQTSNISLTGKITYFPFSRTFLKGISISLGPSIGYTYQSREFQATLVYDSLRQINVRRSYLEYNNGLLLGYRVTVCYKYPITKHFLIGVRLDFDSYTNGDINTLLAGKIGYNF